MAEEPNRERGRPFWLPRQASNVSVPPTPIVTDPPLTAKDGLTVLGFASVFIAMSLLTMFLLAPEVVSCERGAGGPSCRLVRRVAGVPLRARSFDGLQAVSVEEIDVAPQSTQRRGGTTYWIRYYTANGTFEGVSVSTRRDCELLAAELQRFLVSPEVPRFEGRTPGHFMVTHVMPGVFLFGCLGMQNGLRIILRARRSSGASHA